MTTSALIVRFIQHQSVTTGDLQKNFGHMQSFIDRYFARKEMVQKKNSINALFNIADNSLNKVIQVVDEFRSDLIPVQLTAKEATHLVDVLVELADKVHELETRCEYLLTKIRQRQSIELIEPVEKICKKVSSALEKTMLLADELSLIPELLQSMREYEAVQPVQG